MNRVLISCAAISFLVFSPNPVFTVEVEGVSVEMDAGSMTNALAKKLEYGDYKSAEAAENLFNEYSREGMKSMKLSRDGNLGDGTYVILRAGTENETSWIRNEKDKQVLGVLIEKSSMTDAISQKFETVDYKSAEAVKSFFKQNLHHIENASLLFDVDGNIGDGTYLITDKLGLKGVLEGNPTAEQRNQLLDHRSYFLSKDHKLEILNNWKNIKLQQK